MKRISVILGIVLIAIAFASCDTESAKYKKKLEIDTGSEPTLDFKRYEEVLFNLDTANFQQELIAVQKDYQPFLDGDLTDPMAVKYLKDFAIDPFSLMLYQKVKDAFPNLNHVQSMVSVVYRNFNHYYPEISLPSRVFTCVSGITSESSKAARGTKR